MEMVFLILSLLLSFLMLLTFAFWNKQKKLKKNHIVHRSKKLSKFDLIEVSTSDYLFDEYYEPKIVDIVSDAVSQEEIEML